MAWDPARRQYVSCGPAPPLGMRTRQQGTSTEGGMGGASTDGGSRRRGGEGSTVATAFGDECDGDRDAHSGRPSDIPGKRRCTVRDELDAPHESHGGGGEADTDVAMADGGDELRGDGGYREEDSHDGHRPRLDQLGGHEAPPGDRGLVRLDARRRREESREHRERRRPRLDARDMDRGPSEPRVQLHGTTDPRPAVDSTDVSGSSSDAVADLLPERCRGSLASPMGQRGRVASGGGPALRRSSSPCCSAASGRRRRGGCRPARCPLPRWKGNLADIIVPPPTLAAHHCRIRGLGACPGRCRRPGCTCRAWA